MTTSLHNIVDRMFSNKFQGFQQDNTLYILGNYVINIRAINNHACI